MRNRPTKTHKNTHKIVVKYILYLKSHSVIIEHHTAKTLKNQLARQTV